MTFWILLYTCFPIQIAVEVGVGGGGAHLFHAVVVIILYDNIEEENRFQ